MAEGKGDPSQRPDSTSPEVPHQNGTRGNSKLNHFKKDTKTKPAAPSKPSGKSAACKIILLDGEEFECQVDVSHHLPLLFRCKDCKLIVFCCDRICTNSHPAR